MSQPPFFHEDSGAVRFWVTVNGSPVGASITKTALHYRFRPNERDEDPLETFLANVDEINAAVLRRVAKGSIEPIMVREFDLRPVSDSA